MKHDPHVTHALDQLTGTLRDIAKALGAYRDELRAKGFTDEQVWELVKRQETRLLGPETEEPSV